MIEERNPKKGKRIREMLKRKKEERKNKEDEILAINPVPGSPSMSWNKDALIEYAENLDPPIDVLSSWTKQDILDAIEAHEPA